MIRATVWHQLRPRIHVPPPLPDRVARLRVSPAGEGLKMLLIGFQSDEKGNTHLHHHDRYFAQRLLQTTHPYTATDPRHPQLATKKKTRKQRPWSQLRALDPACSLIERQNLPHTTTMSPQTRLCFVGTLLVFFQLSNSKVQPLTEALTSQCSPVKLTWYTLT